MIAGPEKTLVIELAMKDGDPLGATPDEKLVLIEIQKGTVAFGKLQIGDRILCVNNIQPKDMHQFFQLLNSSAQEQNKVTLKIARNENKAKELGANNQIPEQRAKFIKRREGFLYKLVKVDYKQGMKLGLSLKDRQNRVFASKIQPNSMCSGRIDYLDQLHDVDGIPITDRNVTADLIRMGLQKNMSFTAVIARPISDTVRKEIEDNINRSIVPPKTTGTDSGKYL